MALPLPFPHRTDASQQMVTMRIRNLEMDIKEGTELTI
jgi:hypothetical protein